MELKFSTLKQKVAGLETQIKNKEQELITLSENFKQQFTSSQNLRDQTARTKLDDTLQLWDDAEKKYSEQIKQSEENIQKSFDEKYEDLKKQTKSIIDDMKEKQEEIKKIYGLVGDIVSCGEYKKYAQNEHNEAKKLFWISFDLFCGAALIMAIAIIRELFNDGDFSWWSVLTRLPIAVVILLPAF